MLLEYIQNLVYICFIEINVSNMVAKSLRIIVMEFPFPISVRIPSKQNTYEETGRNLGSDCCASQDENQSSCFAYQTSLSHKVIFLLFHWSIWLVLTLKRFIAIYFVHFVCVLQQKGHYPDLH